MLRLICYCIGGCSSHNFQKLYKLNQLVGTICFVLANIDSELRCNQRVDVLALSRLLINTAACETLKFQRFGTFDVLS